MEIPSQDRLAVSNKLAAGCVAVLENKTTDLCDMVLVLVSEPLHP